MRIGATRLATLCLSLVTALLSAPAPRAQTVFRASAELVQLDIRVLDRNRQPVRGLTAADFVILEDGKPQPISAFASVDVPDAAAAAPTATWMRTVASDVRTNDKIESPEGRLWVILLDDAMMPADPMSIKNAKEIARKAIDRMTPLDQVAVVFSAGSGGTQNFTSDRARLFKAIDTLSGGHADYSIGWNIAYRPDPVNNPAYWLPGPDPDILMKQGALETLSMVAETLIAAPQRRKALIYISPGVAVDMPIAVKPRLALSLVSLEANREMYMKMPELFRRMQNANVTINPVDPTGLAGLDALIASAAYGWPALRMGQTQSLPSDYNWLAPAFVDPTKAVVPRPAEISHHLSRLSLDFLLTAAENTGGKAVINTNEFDTGLDAIFQENASYYLVGYTMPPTNKPGSLHRLQAKVNRPGVTVVTRTGYEVEKGDKTPSTDATSAAAKRLRTSIAGPVAAAGIPARVAVAALAVSGRREAAVTLAIGFDEPPVDARTPRTMDVQFAAYTPDGRAVGKPWNQTATFIQSPKKETTSYDVLTQLALAPGRYEVRIGLRRAEDNVTGSVYADVDVPDFAKAPLSVSGLIVEADPTASLIGRDALSAVVPARPSTRREFARTDQVSIFFRIYQGGDEAIQPVVVAATIVNDHDVTVAEPRGEIPVEQFNATSRSADHRFAVPLSTLTPGEYLVSFQIALGDQTVTRAIRITVK